MLNCIINFSFSQFIFVACSQNDSESENVSLREKLTLFENGLKSKNQNYARTVAYNIDSLSNDKNEYDDEGRLFWDVYKNIEEEAEVHIPNPIATFQTHLEPFVIQEFLVLDSISLSDLNTDEKLLMDSFEENFEPSVELILDYEDFVYDNFTDQSDVENFLIIISRLKYIIFAFDADVNHRRTLSGWESCLNNCMRRHWASLNAVGWLWFASHPGGAVIEAATTCAWDCRRDGYYGH